MWDKYGEFDSFEEINDKAKELLAAGQVEEVRVLARENGIATEIADYYITGAINFLCDSMTSAIGKMNKEIEGYQKRYVSNAKEVKEALEMHMSQDIIKYSIHKYGVDIDINITGDDLAKAIRKKGKSLNDICKAVLTRAQKIHQEGNPASAMVVPMVINEYMKTVKTKKDNKAKKGDK